MKYNVIDTIKLWTKGFFRLILGKNRSVETCLHSNIHYQLKLLVALVTVSVSACSDDGVRGLDGPESAGSERFIVLKIAVPTGESAGATRGNPMGGEDGNGREDGILNENKIHDLNIFFYNDSQNHRLNAEYDTRVNGFYFDFNSQNSTRGTIEGPTTGANGIKYYTVTIPYEGEIANLEKTVLSFITIANVGMAMTGITTLGALREYKGLTKTWTGDAQNVGGENYDRFVMSTAYSDQEVNGVDYGSSTIDFTKAGTKNQPYFGETTVERLCARLDLWYNSADNGNNNEYALSELVYSVKGDNNTEIATVHITNVLPVNVMQTPSYLFKKVTNEQGIRSDWSASALGSSAFKWGGVENPHPNTDSDEPTNYVLEPTTLLKNTSQMNMVTCYGTTAVATVKGSWNASGTITDASNGKIGGYYHCTPAPSTSPNYGCNMVAIIGYANENTHPTDCFKADYLTGLAFRAVYEPAQVITNYNPDKQENPFTYDNSDYSTGKTFFRYCPTNQSQSEATALYFQNMYALNAYKTRHPGDNAIVTEFTGGICYYNLWLKHYDDVDDGDGKSDPHEALPMEYATVRNNIYRVAISFSGPGDPTPELREPNHIHSRIFVRPWNQRKENNPIVF